MSKFNSNVATAIRYPADTVNKEGFGAYRMDWKTKLITMVLTSFFNEEKFYGDNSQELVNCLKSGIVDDPEFVSNLAIFARREFNMRSVSHVILGYLAHEPAGKPYVKRTLKEIVLRGDDATEILSFYLSTFGKPIPNSLRKGLRDIFPKFDAYTLAKYKGEGHAVKMRDILCLCRPKPLNDEQAKLWKDLLEGTIKPAYTWETELSAKGNKKEVWEELIDSGKVGYMALLRNLRNILNVEPENIGKVIAKIEDPEAVRSSKQLPFRYLSAYRNIPTDKWDSVYVKEALEKAAEIAVENLPKIPGKTIIAIDTSASMRCSISDKSDVRCCDISMLLGIIADKICEKSLVYTFDTNLKQLSIPRRTGILESAMQYSNCGGGTNMYLPFEEILDNHISADRMIILSDNECNYNLNPDYNSIGYPWSWYDNKYSKNTTAQVLADKYRNTINHNFWVHAIDLQGYGTQQFNGDKTNIIAGWSEKIFEFISLTEKGTDSLIKRISEYKAHY